MNELVNVKTLIISSVLVAVLSLVKFALSEAVLGKILLILLRHLAKKTSNSIDDEIVEIVQAALDSKSQ